MNTLIKFFKDPLVLTITAVVLILIFALYADNNASEVRDKWIDACHEEGGNPYLIGGPAIGRSVCLKPNSIITVHVYE